MNAFFFAVFLTLTLVQIWRAKQAFTARQWLHTGLMLVLVICAPVVIGFVLKWLAQSFSLFSVATAKRYTIMLSMSFLCMWGVHLLAALLGAVFSGIMGAHKKHNSQHYDNLAEACRTVVPGLRVIVKLLVSYASVLMLTGIWLG
ncbi:hypothetical protein NTD86_04440 [Pseudomonas sp. 7P_10.2_Bac1]|uniref:hypothetical protein n=1 Tax=Pseudomonas sp. 7P_10.2_Bac1 TaxID=2971614 RepID=UPI0021C95487|nr:hypothetical protein [Pseudomonas sp. 7P_10.2_Bac1]MCU1726237.1 hypothetical protein [Pseudomonas sp. 7P_10.2_Bac1]